MPTDSTSETCELRQLTGLPLTETGLEVEYSLHPVIVCES